MIPHRNSTIGTVVGVTVVVIAVVGTTVLDWTWKNPDGQLLPLTIGVIAAAAAVGVLLRKFDTSLPQWLRFLP